MASSSTNYYGQPSPPRSFLFLGTGWGYGIGCGVGPFLGIGVGMNKGAIFGAGAGVGAFCGVGFAAGLVGGGGTGYIPYGLNTSFFLTPRLGWAERRVERLQEPDGRAEVKNVLSTFTKMARKIFGTLSRDGR